MSQLVRGVTVFAPLPLVEPEVALRTLCALSLPGLAGLAAAVEEERRREAEAEAAVQCYERCLRVAPGHAGATATATWTASAPYSWSEYHLYIGDEPLARDRTGDYTVAPGQYPEVIDGGSVPTGELSRTLTVDGLSGDVFVVAHAVSCGAGE